MSKKETTAVQTAQQDKPIVCGKAKRVSDNVRSLTLNMDVLEKFINEHKNFDGGVERYVKVDVCDFEKDGLKKCFVKIENFRSNSIF